MIKTPKKGFDYAEYLSKCKCEFETKWESMKPSEVPKLGNAYQKLVILGQGAFGTVRLYRNKDTETYYAVKILIKAKIIKDKQLNQIFTEKRILLSMNHPFLVKAHYVWKDFDCVYFVMNFINGGELFTHLRSKRKFDETLSKFYAAQICLALEYLHYLNLIHRDLKPENILLDANGYLKITDFGFCKRVPGRTWTLCGTPEYMAPEVIQTKAYGSSVDWWSFGILIYEMCAGKSPFYRKHDDHISLFRRICEEPFKSPKHFSPDLDNLLYKLLQVDPTKRYERSLKLKVYYFSMTYSKGRHFTLRFGNLKDGATAIKEHNWFKGISWISILKQNNQAPFVPKLKSMGDVSNFEKYPEQTLPSSKTCQYEKEFEGF